MLFRSDYLAKRDAEWMSPIYQFLGLTVGVNVSQMSPMDKREAYAADITYGTNNEFGFDYLRDNMKFRLEDYVQRALNYAIIDEVDSILIDEARTPLIISGSADESVDLYKAINVIIPTLEKIIELIKEHENKTQKNHKIQIEIKTEPNDSHEYVKNFVDAIAKVLVATDFVTYTELQSFDWRSLIYAKQILPDVKTSFITQQNAWFDSFAEGWTAGYKLEEGANSIPHLIATLGGNIWCPDYKDLTAELIKEAHSYNIKVIPWTVDDTQAMSQLIDWDIDGIITNFPDRLKNLLNEKKM